MIAGSPLQDPIGAVAIKGGPGWRPRQDERWWPGLSLALVAHLALVAALALAVNWKVRTEVAVEAEVWSEIPQAAGPAQAPPPAEVPPEPVVAKVVPPAPTPEPAPEPLVEPKLDIVEAKVPPKPDKKRKERKEPQEVFETTPPKAKAKPEPKKEAKQEVKPEPKVEPKVDAKAAAAAAKAEAQSAVQREALRQANLARMMSDLGGGPGGAGRAAVASGPSKSYLGRLIARIKPNINFPDLVNGNPLAQVEVRCAPDGRILASKVVVSSGVPAWDAAVVRALDRTEVLPLNEQGRIEPVMLLDFRPKDF